MKALKVILIIIAVLFGGYCIWMATLPTEYDMERTAVIDAEPEVVFTEVNTLTEWPKWSPWYKIDTTAEYEYSDVVTGEGAYYTWSSTDGNMGSGKYTNTTVVPNEEIVYTMEFEGMGGSEGYWNFEPVEDSKTKVTWGFHTEFDFFSRVWGVFMDDMLGPQFEEGLDNLKSVSENMPKKEASPAADISVTQVESMPYYGITDEVSWADMGSDFFAERYGALATYLGEDMKNTLSAPFAIYHVWDEENKMAKVEIAIATTSTKPGNDRIKKGNTYAGTVVKGVHLGAYDKTGDLHMALYEYVGNNNYEMAGSPWESYVTDPGTEPDTTKWVTEIYYPVMQSSTASAE
ncbi:SRPBCC family protein [Owenweeksia hongkongensis]|uniref:SRPBCC family protein n=1 Tax=Owenweeksia hongkongensis TaxID=253245 RepID=UPI003A94A10B